LEVNPHEQQFQVMAVDSIDRRSSLRNVPGGPAFFAYSTNYLIE